MKLCKKIVVIALVLLMMCSCKTYTKQQVIDELNSYFISENSKQTFRQNNFTEYFDYYLPSDVFEDNSSPESCCFIFNTTKILMNLNISYIINQEYYPSDKMSEVVFDNKKLVFHKEGNYQKYDQNTMDFQLKIFEYDDKYFVLFATPDMYYYAFTPLNEIVETCKHLLIIAKGVSVKKNEILANYSTKDVIDYQKKIVNLFDYIIPKEGRLSDYLDK